MLLSLRAAFALLSDEVLMLLVFHIQSLNLKSKMDFCVRAVTPFPDLLISDDDSASGYLLVLLPLLQG
jgi:hypothetical protein